MPWWSECGWQGHTSVGEWLWVTSVPSHAGRTTRYTRLAGPGQRSSIQPVYIKCSTMLAHACSLLYSSEVKRQPHVSRGNLALEREQHITPPAVGCRLAVAGCHRYRRSSCNAHLYKHSPEPSASTALTMSMPSSTSPNTCSTHIIQRAREPIKISTKPLSGLGITATQIVAQSRAF